MCTHINGIGGKRRRRGVEWRRGVEGGGNGQFRILLRIQHGGDGDPEVGDWAPEIWMRVEMSAFALSALRERVVLLGGLRRTHGLSIHSLGRGGSVSLH